MSADLHIHVLDWATEDDLRRFFCHTMGSKYFNLTLRYDEVAHDTIAATPHVHVGEVSWLKADLFEDPGRYVPGPVQAVYDVIGEELPVIDDALIEKIRAALSIPNSTSYRVSKVEPIIEFLETHRGKRVFTVSW